MLVKVLCVDGRGTISRFDVKLQSKPSEHRPDALMPGY